LSMMDRIVDRTDRSIWDSTVVWGACSLALLVLVLGLQPALSPFGMIVAVAAVVLAIDGLHVAQSFVRSFFDPTSPARRNGPLFRTAWLVFLIPATWIFVALAVHAPHLVDALALLMGVLSAHHVVSQHYGLMRLFGAGPTGRHVRRRFWLVGMALPILLSLGLREVPLIAGGSPNDPLFFRLLPWTFAVSAAISCFALGSAARAREGRYTFWFLSLYSALYFLLPSAGTILAIPENRRRVITASLLISLFHNVPFLGFFRAFAGKARRVEETAGAYRARWCFLGGFAAVYASAFSVSVLADYDFPGTSFWIGLSIYYGLLLQHYLLENRVWRFHGDPTLKRIWSS
jgi:hypothetical protein